MLNPLYLNDLSRSLYCSNNKVYVALLPCATTAAVGAAKVRAQVRGHLGRLFNIGEQQQQKQQQSDVELCSTVAEHS